MAVINAERAFTRALGASCHSPVAALATIEKGSQIRLRAQLLTEDGSAQVSDEATFECGDNDAPQRLAEAMLKDAPQAIRRLFAAG
jgi:hydroxymethylbilane synthase